MNVRVLCSKSAADAANLSIFTLRHVYCGLSCATSPWGQIECMIADAWNNQFVSLTPSTNLQYLSFLLSVFVVSRRWLVCQNYDDITNIMQLPSFTLQYI